MAQCLGKKADGTRCQANNALPNGYCPSHQAQVPIPPPRTSRTPATTPPASAGMPKWVKPVVGAVALVALVALIALLVSSKSCWGSKSVPDNGQAKKGMSAESEKPICLEPPDCRRPVKPICLEPPDCRRPEKPRSRYRPRNPGRKDPTATVAARKPQTRYIITGPADDKGGVNTTTIVID